jgi:hypothetical protein
MGGWRRWGKVVSRWIWCKYCEHMNIKAKMIPLGTIPGRGGSRMMEG